MSARAYEIKLISAERQQVSNVVAHSAVAAIRIALAAFAEPAGSCALIIKPLPGLCADEPVEVQPCAA